MFLGIREVHGRPKSCSMFLLLLVLGFFFHVRKMSHSYMGKLFLARPVVTGQGVMVLN